MFVQLITQIYLDGNSLPGAAAAHDRGHGGLGSTGWTRTACAYSRHAASLAIAFDPGRGDLTRVPRDPRAQARGDGLVPSRHAGDGQPGATSPRWAGLSSQNSKNKLVYVRQHAAQWTPRGNNGCLRKGNPMKTVQRLAVSTVAVAMMLGMVGSATRSAKTRNRRRV